MEKVDWKSLEIKPHNIIVACTSEPDYEMQRQILLEIKYDKYVVLEGWHCSCYDFDETEWEAIEYTSQELKELAAAKYNKEKEFWIKVREQIH